MWDGKANFPVNYPLEEKMFEAEVEMGVLSGYTIVLDPGHGGKDGACSRGRNYVIYRATYKAFYWRLTESPRHMPHYIRTDSKNRVAKYDNFFKFIKGLS